jgi:hypothetical protein
MMVGYILFLYVKKVGSTGYRLYSLKCMVCSECAFYFRQGSICNISRNWNSPPKSNSIATLHTAMESFQTHHHLAHAWIACGCRDGVLSFHQNKVARAFYTRWWSDCQVSWCVSKVYLLMFNPKLINQSCNNLHLLKIPNNQLRCDLMSWGYWSRSSQLKQVFGFCEPRKKMFFGTRSTQQSAQQWCNNSTLMGWMFWVSLGTTSCWLERRIDRWFGIFFLAFHLDEAGNNEVQL